MAEWRLFACQRGQCTAADLPHLIEAARSDAASAQEPSRRASSNGQLDAHRAALVSLGRPAALAMIALCDDPSSAMSSLAAIALAELEEPALVSRLGPDIHKGGPPALKAIAAIHATPASSHGANRLLMRVLSSYDPQISDIALEALRQRLNEQDLVDGVLGYVAERDRFTVREVRAIGTTS